MLLLACKAIFTTVLFAIFVTYFGHPYYKKYQENRTMITIENVPFKHLDPPTITVATSRSRPFNGWKPNLDQTYTNLSMVCNISQSYQKVVKCINEKTFLLSDFVENARNADKTQKDLTDATFWTKDLSVFPLGKTYSLNNSYGISSEYPYLHLTLKKNQTYVIQVHDPQFYLINANPGTTPRILLIVDDSTSRYVYINAIYHEKMDNKNQRCESSESYSFTACIKNSISRMIGCRLEWDSWSSRDLPVCTMVENGKISDGICKD